MQIRNAVTGLMKEVGYGKDYAYAHDQAIGHDRHGDDARTAARSDVLRARADGVREGHPQADGLVGGGQSEDPAGEGG